MSGDERDFNNIETRAGIEFPPPPSSSSSLQGKALKEIHAVLTEILGERASSFATVKNWVAQFKYSNFSTCDVMLAT
jgi:hypothetical protein